MKVIMKSEYFKNNSSNCSIKNSTIIIAKMKAITNIKMFN